MEREQVAVANPVGAVTAQVFLTTTTITRTVMRALSDGLAMLIRSAKNMQRKIYKKIFRHTRLKAILITAPLAFALFGFGIYLDIAKGISWATMVCGISSVIIFGLLGLWLEYRFLSHMPCPQCGQTDLKQIEDDELQKFLVCNTCNIHWDTGLSNDYN